MSAAEIVVAVLVVLLIGVTKAGFAGGTGALATPLFCLVVDASQAIAILLPVLCVCDWLSVYHYRKTIALRPLLLALPGALVGIAVGGFLLGSESVDSARLKQIVGAIAVCFVVERVVRLLLRRETYPWKPGAPAATVLGASAGLFSTLAHAAGPIMAAYLLPQKLDRRHYVGTTVAFFTVVNVVKLVPYGYAGLLVSKNLFVSLLMLPVIPFGVWLGVWLNRRMSPTVFLVVVYALLFLSGLQLLGVPTPLELLVSVWS